MKRVAFFMPTLGGGGAERVTIALARGMADRGYQVSLVVAVAAGSLAHEVPENVALVDLQAGRVVAAIWPLARWLRAHRPDALVATQGHANIAAFIARRLAGVKGRLLVREVSTPSMNLRHLRGARGWGWRWLLRYVYRRADVVVAVSQGVGDDLQAYLGCPLPNLRVIYNPVLTPAVYEKARESLDHPWFQEGVGVPVVLAVGRLTKAKNYPLLLRAFAQLRERCAARLLILGEGEERSALEQLVHELGLGEFVAMPGFDANPFRYMARSALYVMSSDWEGLPGSLIQALALCGNAVSTDCPSGPREILENGQFGSLVEVRDSYGLTMRIYEALNGNGLKGRCDLMLHLKNFEFDDVIEKYLRYVADGIDCKS